MINVDQQIYYEKQINKRDLLHFSIILLMLTNESLLFFIFFQIILLTAGKVQQ